MGGNHRKDYDLLRRIRARNGGADPAVAGMLDHEIDRAIERTAEALRATPRSGLRAWLSALTEEKSQRALRRETARGR